MIDKPSLLRRRGARRGGAVLLSAVTLAVGGATLAPSSSRAATAAFVRVGQMPFGSLALPSNTLALRLEIDSGVARGFVVTDATHVRVYDLHALRPITDLTVPTPGFVADDEYEDGSSLATVDDTHHRVFFTQGLTSACSSTYRIMVLDTRALTWSGFSVPCLSSGDAFSVHALSYDAKSDVLYMMGQDGSNDGGGTGSLTLHQFPAPAWTARAMNPSTGKLLWDAALDPPCTSGAGAEPYPNPSIGRFGNAVYARCQISTNNPLLPNRFLNVVVKLPLKNDVALQTDANGQFLSTMYFGVADTSLGSHMDSGGGLITFTSRLSSYGYGAYIFDLRQGVFTGQVAVGGGNTQADLQNIPTSFGYDDSDGRLYLRSQTGLLVVDVRHRPLPGGALYSDMRDTYNYGANGTSTYVPITIGVMPTTHTLFIPDLGTNAWQVYRDAIPPAPDAVAPRPDQATTDVAESPGTTGATYSGSGNAYGLYILSEGGANRVANNSQGTTCPITGIPASSCLVDSGVTPGDRMSFYGHVAQLSLTNDGANAQSAPLDLTDSATHKDLTTAGVYDGNALPAPAPSTPLPGIATIMDKNGVTFPADSVGCQDFGNTPSNPSESPSVGTADASCNLSTATVSADSHFNGLQSPDGSVQVGSYETHVKSYRDASLGEVTTATADAHNISIDLPGAPTSTSTIFIKEIKTTASSQAHGRPGTAHASFSRKIRGFSSQTYSCEDNCNPQQVADAITAVIRQAGFLGAAFVPQPDGAYFPDGTPGGYQAVVAKDQGLQVSEQSVNDDFTDTVAGLEIVLFEDGSNGRGREVLQFAGVHAESHYGIYLLSSESTDTPIPGPSDVPGTTGNNGSSSGGGGGGTPISHTIVKTKVVPRTIIERIANAFEDIIRLIVSDPATAASLGVLWALLLSPVYLGLRRRSLVRRLETTL